MLYKKLIKFVPSMLIAGYELRAVKKKDIKDIYEYASDPEVTKYLSFPTHKSIKDTKKVYNKIIKKYPKLKGLPVPYVIVDSLTNKVIGMIDFNAYDPVENIGTIGYVLNRNYWGKGIMSKMCLALIEHGFFYLEFDKIRISHDVENIASQKVIEKCGFRYIGEEDVHQGLLNKDVRVKKYELTRDEYMKGRF